jgi:hypothetical protein
VTSMRKNLYFPCDCGSKGPFVVGIRTQIQGDKTVFSHVCKKSSLIWDKHDAEGEKKS